MKEAIYILIIDSLLETRLLHPKGTSNAAKLQRGRPRSNETTGQDVSCLDMTGKIFLKIKPPKGGLSDRLEKCSDLIEIIRREFSFFFIETLESTDDLFIGCLPYRTANCRKLLDDLLHSSLIFDHLYDTTDLSLDTTETISNTLFPSKVFDFHDILGLIINKVLL